MTELVDVADLKSAGFCRAGSTPARGTILKNQLLIVVKAFCVRLGVKACLMSRRMFSRSELRLRGLANGEKSAINGKVMQAALVRGEAGTAA